MLFIHYDGLAIMVSVSSLNPTRFHVSLVQAFAKSPRSVITDCYFKLPTPPNRTGHAPIRLSKSIWELYSPCYSRQNEYVAI